MKISESEGDTLFLYAHKIDTLGKSDIRCPRCGKALIYEPVGNSGTIRCLDPECIKLTYRGL